ncbi:MAG TPA: hypothetical protein VNE22_02210 [Acidimicrobiales bacterium]|nr:hypothetical protein [Acidimicrobiales bacterium]
MRVFRVVAAVMLVAAIGVAATLIVINSTKSTKAPCISAAQALARSRPVANLPPSRDNDAFRGRLPDATPDADYDAGHPRPVVCAP